MSQIAAFLCSLRTSVSAQTQPLCSHYCRPDAVQSSSTCSFALISCFSLFYCPPFLSLLLPSDGFDFGAAADADGEQAQRVCGQPEGARLPAQEKRGGLIRRHGGPIKGKIVQIRMEKCGKVFFFVPLYFFFSQHHACYVTKTNNSCRH